jgi:hypothetical protein
MKFLLFCWGMPVSSWRWVYWNVFWSIVITFLLDIRTSVGLVHLGNFLRHLGHLVTLSKWRLTPDPMPRPPWRCRSYAKHAGAECPPLLMVGEGPRQKKHVLLHTLSYHSNSIFPFTLWMQTYMISMTSNERVNISCKVLFHIYLICRNKRVKIALNQVQSRKLVIFDSWVNFGSSLWLINPFQPWQTRESHRLPA